MARLSPVNVVPEILAPKLGSVKLVSCQLELADQKDETKSQSELNLELT